MQIKSQLGWIVAVGLALWIGQGSADAQTAMRVECKAFYQDFPNGMVAPERAVVKAEELGQKLDPWIEQQMAAGAKSVVVHSFIPYGVMGGAELLCVAF